MPTLDSIEVNYFGLTLYVTTRTHRSYACRAWTWEDVPGGKLRVSIQAWPGYGSYRGKITLTKLEKATFLKALEIKV